MAYTPDTIWRNRDTFLKGRDEVEQWLTSKWEKEDGYRLRKELFAFSDNKVGLDEPSFEMKICGIRFRVHAM
jgi:nuclear transport factor 2 (NTF2) superfamily protein